MVLNQISFPLKVFWLVIFHEVYKRSYFTRMETVKNILYELSNESCRFVKNSLLVVNKHLYCNSIIREIVIEEMRKHMNDFAKI